MPNVNDDDDNATSTTWSPTRSTTTTARCAEEDDADVNGSTWSSPPGCAFGGSDLGTAAIGHAGGFLDPDDGHDASSTSAIQNMPTHADGEPVIQHGEPGPAVAPDAMTETFSHEWREILADPT